MLQNFNKIWSEVSSSVKNVYDDKPVNNEKCLRAKIKSYKIKIDTSFHDNWIPKEVISIFCLSAILIDSVLKNYYKNNYPQVSLE